MWVAPVKIAFFYMISSIQEFGILFSQECHTLNGLLLCKFLCPSNMWVAPVKIASFI